MNDLIYKLLIKIYNLIPVRFSGIRRWFILNINTDNFRVIFSGLTIGFLILLGILFINFFGGYVEYVYQDYGYEAVLKNYKTEVDKYAKEFNLPSSYLLALIMLESSGKKYIKPRFEKHIYQKLKQLKKGKIKNFENLKTEDLKKFSRHQLKELASSWGPFQIMGYKTVAMGVPLKVLKGEEVIYWSIKWINEDYGNLIRAGRFKDAFHWHNTGKLFPKDGKPQTYDKTYVDRGLKYMQYFSKYY